MREIGESWSLSGHTTTTTTTTTTTSVPLDSGLIEHEVCSAHPPPAGVAGAGSLTRAGYCEQNHSEESAGGTLSVREQKRVSLQTVERLSVYRKVLEELDRDGAEFIHSHQLAALVGVTPAQLRRDLASFGTFGNISRGYNVYEMSRTISRILGTNETQNVALFGVGDLGRALLSYRGFEERGFHIAVAFDVDTEKVGRVYAGRRCYHVDRLEEVLREFEVHMAILASRPEGLQTLADRVCAAGVHSILNFVPKRVTVPPGCHVEETDISSKLEMLSFLARSEGSRGRGARSRQASTPRQAVRASRRRRRRRRERSIGRSRKSIFFEATVNAFTVRAVTEPERPRTPYERWT